MLYQLSYLGILRGVNGRKVRRYRKRVAGCKGRNRLNSGFDPRHENETVTSAAGGAEGPGTEPQQ
jgi:hypothetical protein